MVCGLGFVVCGLGFVVCGLGFVVCSLGFVVCGFVFVVDGNSLCWGSYFLGRFIGAFLVEGDGWTVGAFGFKLRNLGGFITGVV